MQPFKFRKNQQGKLPRKGWDKKSRQTHLFGDKDRLVENGLAEDEEVMIEDSVLIEEGTQEESETD